MHFARGSEKRRTGGTKVSKIEGTRHFRKIGRENYQRGHLKNFCITKSPSSSIFYPEDPLTSWKISETSHELFWKKMWLVTFWPTRILTLAVSKEPFCLKAGVQLTTDRGGYTYRNIDSGFSELGEDARYPLVPKNFKISVQ